jgi:hypothetical protein
MTAEIVRYQSVEKPDRSAKYNYHEKRRHDGEAFIRAASPTNAKHNKRLWNALDSEAQYYVRRTLLRLPPGCSPIKPKGR